MRFKIDMNLERVKAARYHRMPEISTEQFGIELCQEMLKAGMLADTPDVWGGTVLEVCRSRHRSEFQKVMSKCLFGAPGYLVSGNVYTAFLNLVFIGDGPCPECGGELKFVETEGHELNDGDYYTPNSYVIDRYVYKCCYCGEIVKLEEEL